MTQWPGRPAVKVGRQQSVQVGRQAVQVGQKAVQVGQTAVQVGRRAVQIGRQAVESKQQVIMQYGDLPGHPYLQAVHVAAGFPEHMQEKHWAWEALDSSCEHF